MQSILPQAEIKLDPDKGTLVSLPDDADHFIEELQIEISCSFNMLNKKIHITIYGEEKLELPLIVLSQMYRLTINICEINPEQKKWRVSHLLVKPSQPDNSPIIIAVNKYP